MRTPLLTLVGLWASSLLLAQAPPGAISLEDPAFNRYFMDSSNIPSVAGKIINLSPAGLDSIKINYTVVTPFRQSQIKKVARAASDGTFRLELDYAFPRQQIWLQIEDLLYAALYADSDLYIELDADQLKEGEPIRFNGKGITYRGTDGALTTFMNNHILFKRERQLSLHRGLSAFYGGLGATSYNEFIIQYDSIYSQLSDIDEEYIRENPSPYAWIIRNERLSDYYADLCVKHWRKEMSADLWEKIKNHRSYLVSNSGMGFYRYLFTYQEILAQGTGIKYWNRFRGFSGMDENGKNMIDSLSYFNSRMEQKLPYDTAGYRLLIRNATNYFSDTLTTANTLSTIALLDRNFQPAKSDFLKINIGSKDPQQQQQINELLLTNLRTGWCKEVVESEHEKVLAKLVAINRTLDQSKAFRSSLALGKPVAEMPFEAKLYEVDTMKATELLAGIKSAFPGKALLIDFWATWCGPCLAEMPHSKALHHETEDLPIEYVYLCTSSGSNKDKWQKQIADFEQPGTHIFVEQTIMSELMNLFSVNGFPSYVFIDTEGNYQPGVSVRPSHLDENSLRALISP